LNEIRTCVPLVHLHLESGVIGQTATERENGLDIAVDDFLFMCPSMLTFSDAPLYHIICLLTSQLKHDRSEMVAVLGPYEALPYYIHTNIAALGAARGGGEQS
jgi:hypothetical protein